MAFAWNPSPERSRSRQTTEIPRRGAVVRRMDGGRRALGWSGPRHPAGTDDGGRRRGSPPGIGWRPPGTCRQKEAGPAKRRRSPGAVSSSGGWMETAALGDVPDRVIRPGQETEADAGDRRRESDGVRPEPAARKKPVPPNDGDPPARCRRPDRRARGWSRPRRPVRDG